MSSELNPTLSYPSRVATESDEVDESPDIPSYLARGEPLQTRHSLRDNQDSLDVEIALAQSMLHLSDAITSMMFADEIDRPIAAHERLPIEVLSEIFHSLADPPPIVVPPRLLTTAWSLSQVCTRWRQAAIITREFWEDVKVSLELPEDSDDRQTVMDGVTPLVHNVFSRGTRSVDVILDLKQGTRPGYLAGKGNLLGALIFPFAAQFEHVSLSSVHHILHLFLESPVISFPALKSIAINLDYPRLDFSQMNLDTVPSEMIVFEDAPNLRSVSLTKVGHNDSTLTSPKNCLWNPRALRLPWARLTDVSISGMCISVPGAHRLLSLCRSLRHLRLEIKDIGDRHPDVAVPSSVVLPHLQSLTLRYIREESEAIRIFAPLYLPSLTEFSIRGDAFVVGLTALIARSGCSVRRLEVPMSSHFVQQIEDLLNQVSETLEELVVPKWQIPSWVTRRIANGNLLPNLRVLHCFITLEEDIKPFEEMIQSRWDGGTDSVAKLETVVAVCSSYVPQSRMEALEATYSYIEQGRNFRAKRQFT